MSSSSAQHKSTVDNLLYMMFADVKLGSKLAYGFGTILILLVIMAVISIYQISSLNKDMNQIINDRYRKVVLSNDLIDQVSKIAVAIRNIAVSKDQSFVQKEKERIDAARQKYGKSVEELRNTVKSQEGKAHLEEIEKYITELKAYNNKTIELGAAAQSEEVAKVVTEQLEPGQVKVMTAIDGMIRYQEKLMDEAVKDANQSYHRAFIFLVVISLFAVVTGMLIAYFLNKGITRPINRVIDSLSEAAQEVSASSSQVAGASQSLAEGAQEQASSVEETSSSLEEMSAMTKANADNATAAKAIILNSNQDMNKANDVMKNLIISMNEISAASENTQKIVKTIDEIAFQTNLLALNAAVEAARAGEAGAGFAVVADEVRNLAMRAAEAAKNTQVLIEGTVQKIHSGTEFAQKTNEAFTKVAQDSIKIGQLVSEIAEASKEQSVGVEQVNIAVSEVDKVIQQNAARAEEAASASEEMNAQAEQMKVQVRKLIALVGGRSASEEYRTDQLMVVKK